MVPGSAIAQKRRGHDANKDEKPNTDIVDEDPYAIQIISWCPESRMLCIAGVSAHVIIYRFSKQEVITEVIPVVVS